MKKYIFTSLLSLFVVVGFAGFVAPKFMAAQTSTTTGGDGSANTNVGGGGDTSVIIGGLDPFDPKGPGIENETGHTVEPSSNRSFLGTRFCSPEVTTFCRPRLGMVSNNIIINIYVELVNLYQQLLSVTQD
ncbi:MAG: hypothetical protein PHC89_02925 [Candidatus Pacebacteria bacterium]|nr:hypothetical protein [Candidatus Paceibacterota bacterium]